MSNQTHVSLLEKRRLLIVVLSLFLLFGLLICRFYDLQIVNGETWSRQAQRQHFFFIKEPFMRGTFYARACPGNGSPEHPIQLVSDLVKFHLFADPQAIPAPLRDEIAEQLSRLLNLEPSERIRIRSQLDKKSRSRKLAMWVAREQEKNIRSWWGSYAQKRKLPSNALFFVKDYQRCYPHGRLLGQLLHTVQNQRDETTLQAKPTGGLELSLDRYLRGKLGKRRLMRSPLHALETEEVIDIPEDGAAIYLTIDAYLQAIMEDELEKGVKDCMAKGGWAAMMDPHTGEVLACAQYPFFNPTDYAHLLGNPATAENVKVRAITDANEPGSVFKPFTAALALKANQILVAKGEPPLFSIDEKIPTSSGRFPGRSKPISDTSLHYFLNFDMGMQKSSNIYMGRLAERMIARLGNEWYRKQIQERFGFGERTGIELPAESPGVIPTPGKRHPNGKLEWSRPTPFSLAMGYNLQVTTVQILQAYGILANRGRLVRPTLIRKIVKTHRDGQQEIVLDQTRSRESSPGRQMIEPSIIERVIQAMRYVTKPGGTAMKADVPGYTEVGKTSTTKKIVDGRYSERLYCATFAGFIPVDKPRFVLVITMDEPKYGYIPGVGKNHNGGNCTAKVFQKIALRSLTYLGIPPDDPYGYPPGDKRRNPDKADWIAESQKLHSLYEQWNRSSTQLE